MARKKASAPKSAPRKQAAPKKTRRKMEEPASAEVNALADRTLDLWREQMTVLAQSPQAMQEFSKTFEPVFSLFTQGMDMWLMMLDQMGAAYPVQGWPGAFAASENASHTHAAQRPKQPAQPSAKRKKPAAPRAAAAGPVSGNGDASMAELAKRVATLKERGGRSAAAAASARVAKFTQAVSGDADARQRRRRKA